MPSADSTRAASRDRRRAIDAALTAARQGRGRIRDRADTQVPPSHGEKSHRLPGVHTEDRL
jgi:hypothetical protein